MSKFTIIFLLYNNDSGFWESLDTSEVLAVRRRGAPTEAYKQYAARRSDRPSVAGYCGGWKDNTADDALMVDQGNGKLLYIEALN
jgi:hypothetical protein